jgi:hypothetical protein
LREGKIKYGIFLKARHKSWRSMKMDNPSAVRQSAGSNSKVDRDWELEITTNSRPKSNIFLQEQPHPEMNV